VLIGTGMLPPDERRRHCSVEALSLKIEKWPKRWSVLSGKKAYN